MKSLKKSFILAFCALSITISFAQKSPIIKGKLLNNKFNKVEVLNAYGNERITYGSADIATDGSFVLNTTVKMPDIYRLGFSDKDFFLFTLSPDQIIEVVMDADNLQSVVSVSGSKSMTFVKNAADILKENQHLLDSINHALQSNTTQQLFNNFYQKFNQYHQTNQDVDRYLTTLYLTNDSLINLVQSSSKKEKIDAKQLDNFVYQANKFMKEILASFEPYENYLQNVGDYYDFTKDRANGFNEFYIKVDSYLQLLNDRHGIATSSLGSYMKEMKKWTLLRDSLVYRDIFDKKKEKTDWANVVIAGVKAHENSVVQQKSDYITKIQASNNIGNEILSLVKNNISNIVQQYQIMYNSENEHNNTRLKNLLLENKNDLAVLMFLDIFPKEKNGALHSEIIKALYLQYPENLLVKERYQMENAPATSTAVGAIAPELAFSNPDGKILKLSDLRGKVVLVDFWASWCRPCRMENPHVTAMYQKYHDKGFEVYSVSLDRDKNSWVKAIADDKLVWPNHVSDLKYWSSEGAKIYGVSSIPATFLLDREGRIISKNLRGEALTKTLQEIFGE